MRPWLAIGMLGLTACAEPRDFTGFDETVQGFLTEEGLAGATAAVVHRDEGLVHLRAYGSFTEDRVSLIASSSKVMSAAVVMKLHDDGLLDLDAPITEVLGDWGDHKSDITTAQLLSNSSGMVGLSDDPTYGPYLCQYLSTSDLRECAEKIFTADDADDRVPPDTAYRYGGGGWHLAGGVAVEASGLDWDTLVEQTLVAPCGLENTGYRNHYAQAFIEGGVGDAVTYPSFFEGDLDELVETTNPNIEGGAYTTIGDYAKFLELQLGDGTCGGVRVLTEASVRRMQEDRIGPVYGGDSWNPDLLGYGLGWFVDRDAPVVADPGAFGAVPWIDFGRGYAAMIILERRYEDGAELQARTKPLLDAMFDVE